MNSRRTVACSLRLACTFLLITALCSCDSAPLTGEKRLQAANAILKSLPTESDLTVLLKEASGESSSANSHAKIAALQQSFAKLFSLMEKGRALSDYPEFINHARVLPTRAAETQYRIGIKSLTNQGSDPCIFVVTINAADSITDLRPVIWKS
jgi:hypothetical protein